MYRRKAWYTGIHTRPFSSSPPTVSYRVSFVNSGSHLSTSSLAASMLVPTKKKRLSSDELAAVFGCVDTRMPLGGFALAPNETLQEVKHRCLSFNSGQGVNGGQRGRHCVLQLCALRPREPGGRRACLRTKMRVGQVRLSHSGRQNVGRARRGTVSARRCQCPTCGLWGVSTTSKGRSDWCVRVSSGRSPLARGPKHVCEVESLPQVFAWSVYQSAPLPFPSASRTSHYQTK